MSPARSPFPRGRGIYLLPNLFTLSALFAGFYAVVASMKGHFDNAAIAIFIAMIMDSLDGRVARMTNTVSAFGAQLDSLSDMVSFGVAPALVIYSWSLHSLGKVGWLSAFIFAVATALRLARFNSETEQSNNKRFFRGLACPAGAANIASLVWLGHELGFDPKRYAVAVAIFTIFIAFLMVSNIAYRSFKDLDLKGRVSFIVILAVVLSFVLVSINPPQVLFWVFTVYAFSGPVFAIWRRIKKKG